MSGLQLREVIMLWWDADVRPFYRALPSFIIWELWRRRNRRNHEGKNISYTCNITRNMYLLIKCRRSGMRCSGNLPEMITEVEDYNPRVKVTREFPPNE
ncbi:hypothetical protein KY285_018173 [Solanum tuberosum]|nr:hypothetical protein KY284_018158 [Solanum tuberosum]KAH0703895.1 hypothetical protein KY285_018173 [Solanum tuberosum]